MQISNLDDMPCKPPDPETGDEKEVYAFYGLASYTAQASERGLMQLALLLRLRKIQGATRATYDRESEAIAKRTFGQILKELSEDEALNDLRSLLSRALEERNHLIHHFFWDYAEEFFSEVGRLRMIEELQRATALFSEVDDKVSGVVRGLGEEVGITTEVIEGLFAKLLKDARERYDSA